MKLGFQTKVLGLLEGSIDLHIHSAPDIYPRILTDIELGRQAKEIGMRAILVKNHFVETVGRAQLATEEAGFPVFGGMAMNYPMGGLNFHAVDFALKLGAKVIWMPTIHSREFVKNKSHVKNLAAALTDDMQGIYLLNEDGTLKEELFPIIDLVAKHDVMLATGHVSIPEARAVVREAARRGAKKIIVTHPLATFVGYSIADQKEMLDMGATYLEHTYNDATRQVGHPIKISDISDAVKAIGAEHCILSTDSGQWLNPIPVQQMGICITDMLNLGLSEQEIRTMVADNPARALSL